MHVCKTLSQPNADGLQTCLEWVDLITFVDQLAITKEQMFMLGSPIIGIYSVIIAFIVFNNFSKRV